MTVVRMTSLFVGLPALVTAGGLGRFAAYETTQLERRDAVIRAVGVHALAGLLLTFIAALPHGYLPVSALNWLAMGIVGLTAGALCGAVIGIACTGAPPRQVQEMFSLVKRPGMSLRHLIESEDLGRIGAAVRHRASLMFDGLLDPAAPRPEGASADEADREGGERAPGEEPATSATIPRSAATPTIAAAGKNESAPGVGERGGGEPKA